MSPSSPQGERDTINILRKQSTQSQNRYPRTCCDALTSTKSPSKRQPQNVTVNGRTGRKVSPPTTDPLPTIADAPCPPPAFLDTEETESEDKRSRCRMLFTVEQLERLRQVFRESKYPKAKDRVELANSLGVTHKSVKQWFQNARSKLKKRGTDHVTGFYAKKLAARTNTLSDTTSLEYGRFKITSAASGNVHDARSNEEGIIWPPKRFSPNLDRSMDSDSSGRSNETISDTSDHQEFIIKASSTQASSTPAKWAQNTNVLDVSPRTSPTTECSATPTAAKQLAMSQLMGNREFQQMRQISLPADHPFCNLGNPDFVWPESDNSSTSDSSLEPSCDKEHDSTEICTGQARDDILVGYMSATGLSQPPWHVKAPELRSKRDQTVPSKEENPSGLETKHKDTSPREHDVLSLTHVRGSVPCVKRRRLTHDRCLQDRQQPDCDTVLSYHRGDLPLDLSMKAKRKRDDGDICAREKPEATDRFPTQTRITPPSQIVQPLFHLLASGGYPFQFYPFGVLPFNLPNCYF